MKLILLFLFLSCALTQSYSNSIISYRNQKYTFVTKSVKFAPSYIHQQCKNFEDGRYACLYIKNSIRMLLFEIVNGEIEGNVFLFHSIDAAEFMKETSNTYAIDSSPLAYELSFVKGKYQGIQKRFYRNGKEALVTHYIDGRKEGEEVRYHKNGALWVQLNYTKGNVQNEAGVVFYYSNGNKEKEGQMRGRKLWGNWVYYYPNGKKKAMGKRGANFAGLNDGARIGKWIFYDEQERKLEQVLFKVKENMAFSENRLLEVYKVIKNETQELIEQTKEFRLDYNNWIDRWVEQE